MQKQFTPCPACGALGEVNSTCQFCGTTIILKEGAITSDTRLVESRTVTAIEYANKISIYHDVEQITPLALSVSIGKQFGLINLNGDLVLPLGERKIKDVWADTVVYDHDRGYYHLKNGDYANRLGMVKENNQPQRMHRVDVMNGWKTINTYISIDGNTYSYDYAESIQINREYSNEFYLLHNNTECALWIPYDEYIDTDSSINKEIREKSLKGDPTAPICILKGIQKEYKIKKDKDKLQIVLYTLENKEISLLLASGQHMLRDDDYDTYRRTDEIYHEWCLKRILNGISVNRTLLHPIQSYVKRIKEDRYYEEALQVHFFNDMIFFIENNNAERDFLPSEDGVSLTTVEDIMNEQQWRILKKDKIYELFNNSETYANIFINFGMDAEALCATIQYLARCYNCPIEKVKILNSGSEKSEKEKERTLNPVNIILAILSFAMAAIPIIVGEYTIKGFIVFLFFLFCGIVYIKKRYI